MNAVKLTPSPCEQIVEVLRDSHEKAKVSTRKQIEDFQVALKKLESREDDLYFDLRNGKIDDSVYQRHVKRVREEREHFITLMAQANEIVNEAFNETAESLIELAMSAKEL